jgi:SP family general alpha glucoside:H+ symporter-like MFS transporter
MTVSYAAEVMPIQIRPFLTTYVNLCWVIGQIICSGVNRALIDNKTEWAYKIPFAIQWIWPIPIFIGIFLAPESPWWLTRKGRFEDAERAINKLVTGVSPDFAKKEVAMMHHTNQLELEASVGTSYRDCFRGVNFRRTEIACIVWLIQTISGSPLMGSATYFFVSAGLPANTASTLNLIMFVVGGVGTASSWFLMKPFGRRDIYLVGQCILVVIMLITAILGTVDRESQGAQWGIGALLIIFTFVYDITIGPVCYSLVAEIGSTRLRSKTVVLARNLYNIGGVVVGVINPYMLNTTAWNLGPKSGYLWAATGACGLVWTFFRLPEPKGRSYGELDLLFDMKVPARKFKETQVQEFEETTPQVGGAMIH